MTTIPTIQELYNSILADLENEFDVTLNPLGKAFLVGIAGVWAMCLYLYYLAIADVQKNIWVDTADSVSNGGTLERFGKTILGRYPFAAQPGKYKLQVTGSVGAVIPSTMVWRADDSSNAPGKLYQLDGGDYTLTATTDYIYVNALEGGTDSSLNLGDTLTATAPMVNVNASAVVNEETVAPINAETTEEYRTKIIEKIQLEPGSWSAVDYRLVGLNIAGVGQTYAYAASSNNNEVNVFLQGTTPVPSPGPSVDQSIVDNYTAALELVRPLGVWQVNYNSCPINNIEVTITMGTFPPFTTEQQNAIQAALGSFINSVHPFIAACDVLDDRNDVITTLGSSKSLQTVIAAAVPGFGFESVSFTVDGNPTTYWQAGDLLSGTQGHIPFFAGATFI